MTSIKPEKNVFFRQTEKLPGWGQNLYPMYDFLLQNEFTDPEKKYEIAEVGVFCGQSALHLCSGLQGKKVKYNIKLVDIWDSESWHSWQEGVEKDVFWGTMDDIADTRQLGKLVAQIQMLKAKHIFEHYEYNSYTDMIRDIFAINGFVDNIELMNCGSSEASITFEKHFFDMVAIDANHDKLFVQQDLQYWTSKVRPGGIVCGDDFQMAPVREAVLEHFDMHPMPVENFSEEAKFDFIWTITTNPVTTFCVFRKEVGPA